MIRRTKYGLTLHHDRGGWDTEDGLLSIGRARAISMCERAHPMRSKDEYGITVTGWCPGGEEHDSEVGWVVEPVPPFMPDDLYETLDDAWQTLAVHLTKQEADTSGSPMRKK